MRILSDVGRLLVAAWATFLAMMFLASMLGCALAPAVVETSVRRFDSLGAMDADCDELGREGWRVVAIESLANGSAYVVVLQRRAVLR